MPSTVQAGELAKRPKHFRWFLHRARSVERMREIARAHGLRVSHAYAAAASVVRSRISRSRLTALQHSMYARAMRARARHDEEEVVRD